MNQFTGDAFLSVLFWAVFFYGLRLTRRGALKARLALFALSVFYLLLRLRGIVDRDIPWLVWALTTGIALAWYLSGQRKLRALAASSGS